MSALDALDVLDMIKDVSSFEYLLETFSRVNEYSSKDMLPKPVTNQGEKLTTELVECLSKEWMSESQELVQLLSSPFFKLLIGSCDTICKSIPNCESLINSNQPDSHIQPSGSVSDHQPSGSVSDHQQSGSVSDHYIAIQSTTSGTSSRLVVTNPASGNPRGGTVGGTGVGTVGGARSRTTLCSSNHYYEEPYLEPYYESIQTQSIGGFTANSDDHLIHGNLIHDHLTDGNLTDTWNQESMPRFTVKLVQIVKGDEPLGVTITIDEETNLVIINRLIHGGAGHRSGLISVGDIIYEINGIPLRGRIHRDILKILSRESKCDSISFKLLLIDTPLSRSQKTILNQSDIRSVVFVKAHFDYNPCLDQSHPCTEAGLVFKRGDILEVVSQEDPCWWQGRHADLEPELEPIKLRLELGLNLGSARAGLIPSITLQEKRVTALRDVSRCKVKKKYVEIQCVNTKPCILRRIQWSKDKVRKVMYKISEAEAFESADVPTYEEVIQLYPTPGYCRPIVIFSASRVGRNKLIRRLLSVDPCLFKRPIAHTTKNSSDKRSTGRSNGSSNGRSSNGQSSNGQSSNGGTERMDTGWSQSPMKENSPRGHEYKTTYTSLGKYTQKESEYDLNEYIHVSEEWMRKEIEAGNFIESVCKQGSYFGIHRESIRSIIASGQVCILSLQTSGLKNVRNSLFKPFVVFLKPPKDLKKFKESRKYYTKGTGQVLRRSSLLFSSNFSLSNFSLSNFSWYNNNGSSGQRPGSKISNRETPTVKSSSRETPTMKSSSRETPTVKSSSRETPKSLTATNRTTYGRNGRESKCSSNYTCASNYSLNDEQLIKVIIESAKLEYLYGPYFDVIIVMEDFESALKQLIQVIHSVQNHPHWAPASWL